MRVKLISELSVTVTATCLSAVFKPISVSSLAVTNLLVVVVSLMSSASNITIPVWPFTESTAPVPEITMSPDPSKDTLLIVFILVPDTRVSCFAFNAFCKSV